MLALVTSMIVVVTIFIVLVHTLMVLVTSMILLVTSTIVVVKTSIVLVTLVTLNKSHLLTQQGAPGQQGPPARGPEPPPPRCQSH